MKEKAVVFSPFINLIENNKRNVSLETLVKLLSSLNVSLSDFFLPFSQGDEEVEQLLLLLQQSSNKSKYVGLFTEVLKLLKK